ncbi:hypothetical protein Tco_0972108 [Tanacetum coccineum]
MAILVHRVQVTEGVQREQGRRIVGVESAVTALTERIAELETDNRRLRGTTSVEGAKNVADFERGRSEAPWATILRYVHWKMLNTGSRAFMTHEEIEDLVSRRVAKEREAREAAMNLEPLNESRDEQDARKKGAEMRNGGIGQERINGDKHINGNHDMNYRGFIPVARECTFQDFLKCKPHNFLGSEGVDSALFGEIRPLENQVECVVLRTDSQKMAEKDHEFGMLKCGIKETTALLTHQMRSSPGFAARSVSNKRYVLESIQGLTMDNNQPFQRQRHLYHHVGPCTVKYNNCKRVGHQMRDCTSAAVVPNMQRAPLGNQQGVICYECGTTGYREL